MSVSDNWHRRFGKMWWAILIMFFLVVWSSLSVSTDRQMMEQKISELRYQQNIVNKDLELNQQEQINKLEFLESRIMPSAFKQTSQQRR